MRYFADLHIHSLYSRATSKQMILEDIEEAAAIKGINVVGTGDFTHPQWFQSLKEKLEPAEEGFYKLKSSFSKLADSQKSTVRFVITGEIANIYSRGGRVRRIHNLIILSSLEAAEKVNNALSWQGNLKADGRPILGLDSEELLSIVMKLDSQALFIPAHIWTPWFGIFGSMSGFDSLEEAFGDNTKYLAALETGLSSTPEMNWRLSALDKFTLVSNSDAHSLDNLGREANVLDADFNYSAFREVIVNKDKQKFLYTIEFFPEEGKYHYDGHRLCQVCFSPEQTKEVRGICPRCHKPLTIGVLNRVDQLADRRQVSLSDSNNFIPFKKLVPLKEIIANVLKTGVKTKLVNDYYNKLIQRFSSEFNILLNVTPEELVEFTDPLIVSGIVNVRSERLNIKPGYDGEYGKIEIFSATEAQKQKHLSPETQLGLW